MAEKQQHEKITGYRNLTEEEISVINELKGLGNKLGDYFDTMKGVSSFDQRCVSLAYTHMQECFMWAIRAVARPEGHV